MPNVHLLALFAGAVFATSAFAQTSPGTPRSPAVAPPAFQPGMAVIDRAGAVIGTFEAFATGPAGPLAVLQVDGKPVAVPQATLTLVDRRILSIQTKAEILAAADVPR